MSSVVPTWAPRALFGSAGMLCLKTLPVTVGLGLADPPGRHQAIPALPADPIHQGGAQGDTRQCRQLSLLRRVAVHGGEEQIVRVPGFMDDQCQTFLPRALVHQSHQASPLDIVERHRQDVGAERLGAEERPAAEVEG